MAFRALRTRSQSSLNQLPPAKNVVAHDPENGMKGALCSKSNKQPTIESKEQSKSRQALAPIVPPQNPQGLVFGQKSAPSAIFQGQSKKGIGKHSSAPVLQNAGEKFSVYQDPEPSENAASADQTTEAKFEEIKLRDSPHDADKTVTIEDSMDLSCEEVLLPEFDDTMDHDKSLSTATPSTVILKSPFDTSCESSIRSIEQDSSKTRDGSFDSQDMSKYFDDSFVESTDRIEEYRDEIRDNIFEMERKMRPSPNYMANQPDINAQMRAILVDWLVEVCMEYKLHDETLFLTVDIIDRYLSVKPISREDAQLLGTAALFMVSKYEEIYPPDLDEFVYITDETYNKFQILDFERQLLKVIQFNVSTPTIHYFLDFFMSESSIPQHVRHMANYLCSLTLQEYDPFIKYRPSEVAMASIVVASHACNYHLSKEFQYRVFYYERKHNIPLAPSIARMQRLVENLHDLHSSAAANKGGKLQAIHDKFKEDKYLGVSAVIPPQSPPSVPYKH